MGYANVMVYFSVLAPLPPMILLFMPPRLGPIYNFYNNNKTNIFNLRSMHYKCIYMRNICKLFIEIFIWIDCCCIVGRATEETRGMFHLHNHRHFSRNYFFPVQSGIQIGIGNKLSSSVVVRLVPYSHSVRKSRKLEAKNRRATEICLYFFLLSIIF